MNNNTFNWAFLWASRAFTYTDCHTRWQHEPFLRTRDRTINAPFIHSKINRSNRTYSNKKSAGWFAASIAFLISSTCEVTPVDFVLSNTNNFYLMINVILKFSTSGGVPVPLLSPFQYLSLAFEHIRLTTKLTVSIN